MHLLPSLKHICSLSLMTKQDWISLIFFLIKVLTGRIIVLQTEVFDCRGAVCTSAGWAVPATVGSWYSPTGRISHSLELDMGHTPQPGLVDACCGQACQPLFFLIFLISVMGIQSRFPPLVLWAFLHVFSKGLRTILYDNNKLSF